MFAIHLYLRSFTLCCVVLCCVQTFGMEREKLTDLNNTALPKLKDQLDKDLVSCHSYRCCLGCILRKMAAVIIVVVDRSDLIRF